MKIYQYIDPKETQWLAKAIKERDEDEKLEFIAWRCSMLVKMVG